MHAEHVGCDGCVAHCDKGVFVGGMEERMNKWMIREGYFRCDRICWVVFGL